MKSKGFIFMLIVVASSCRRMNNNDVINAGAIKYSGNFITQNIPSIPTLRIVGRPNITNNSVDSLYHITGMVEGFSPLNYPVTTEHFSETLRYRGGDPNDSKSWTCEEIYVGKKKMK